MSDTERPEREEIAIYQADGGDRIRVILEGETVWLPQRLIADLYGAVSTQSTTTSRDSS